MDNMIWRFRAKVVAYVEMMLLYPLLVVIGLVMVADGITAKSSTISCDMKYDEKLVPSDHDLGMQDKDVSNMMSIDDAILQTFAAIWELLTCIYLWAAIKLYKSSKLGAESNLALGQARIWRTTSIICTIFTLFLCLGLPIYIPAVILVWRVGTTVVVHKFIKELECIAANAGNMYLTVVVISKVSDDRTGDINKVTENFQN